MKFFVGFSFLFYTAVLSFILGASVIGLGTPNFAGVGGIGLLVGFAAFVLLVLYTGMVALLISAHDRLCDIVGIMARRNELLETSRDSGAAARHGETRRLAD